MEFQDIQKEIIKNADKYGRDFGIKIDKEFCVLKLMEETGEFAEAVLTREKKSRPEKHLSTAKAQALLARELADVLGMVIVTANIFGVDLEKALSDKWINRQKR